MSDLELQRCGMFAHFDFGGYGNWLLQFLEDKDFCIVDFGGYDYWRLWILAGKALAFLKFGVCGCRPSAFIRLSSVHTWGFGGYGYWLL